METFMDNEWLRTNQDYLSAALAQVRTLLEEHAAKVQTGADGASSSDQQTGDPPPPRAEASDRTALETVCMLFGLSPFERDILLLCAGMELDATFAGLCAQAQGDPQKPYPTLGLALALFPQAHWSALSPAAPLRYWQLVEVGAGNSMVASPLRIDERIVHFLTGIQHLDEHLVGFVKPVLEPNSTRLVPSHAALADGITGVWSQPSDSKLLPAVQLCGHERVGKRAIALASTQQLGLNLHEMSAHVLPVPPHDLDLLIRLWEREAALSNSALLFDCETVDPADHARANLINHFIENVGGVLLIGSHERRQTRHRPLLSYDVEKPTSQEQRLLWEEAIGPAAAKLNGHVARLVSQFHLDSPSILAACNRVAGQVTVQQSAGKEQADIGSLLWEACRMQARPHLEDLAQRIEPVATWDDLILPDAQLDILHDVAIQVRQRSKVYDAWGFAAKSSRGLGISALFAGPSGTGKTMASEVLANELNLDLYRIDLSQVVSKYIGETEKNLRRVFDVAEEGGAILLFDEADALFGKRSEVKDSHDRYANIEVSYLLQRMEAYRGLAILTTNMKNSLDDAFMRRIRFVVQFPFPDRAQRAAIWRSIYPAETPTDGLDWSRLAQLNVAGGNIRNIALHAAFLAAEAEQPVSMDHILGAARAEYAKLEKPLTASETRGVG